MPSTSKRRLLAGAICAVTLLLACHDDRLTAPAGPELRPLIPVPVGNNTHPKNSPNHVLNAPPSRCVALLSLATPLDPDHFILDARYRRHLTVKHDILRLLSMDYPGVFELETPLSRELDQLLPQRPIEQRPVYRAAWGKKIHGAAENYLTPDSSVVAVKNRLTQLRQACLTAP